MVSVLLVSALAGVSVFSGLAVAVSKVASVRVPGLAAPEPMFELPQPANVIAAETMASTMIVFFIGKLVLVGKQICGYILLDAGS